MKIGIKNIFYPDDEQRLIIEDTFNKYGADNKGLAKEDRAKPLRSFDNTFISFRK